MDQVTAPITVLQIATINKPISSQNGYGPIETVIYNIDKGLDALGHRSIVACSADSHVVGEKWSTISRSLGDYCRDQTPFVESQTEHHLTTSMVRASRGDVDVVHLHEWGDRVYAGRLQPPVPVVMTLHVPAAQSGFAEAQAREPGRYSVSPSRIYPVAISEFQRRQYEGHIDVAETIPHGLDVDDYLFNGDKNATSYLFSIGRITPDKGQDTAITVARRTGAKLIIAGCVQNKEADRAFFAQIEPSLDLVVDLSGQAVTETYYNDVMKPLLDSDKQIIYVGELASAATKHWYRHARATLFPIRWGEPFGMVLIESMASGTPVLAVAEGSVPEIVKHGETGLIVASTEEMVQAVGGLGRLDRRDCLRHVRSNFSTQSMAESYAGLYERLTGARARSAPASVSVAEPRWQPTHPVAVG